ncbi:opioid growth factor receptor-like, partial [Hyperolius riggenbachi]|uniref:opioid growth factor receptor-like n=1 Tax=Hyperolius riggenbachi TaxID=752182 RepID=UPI0035A3B912
MAFYNSNYSTTPEHYDSEYDSTWDDYKKEEPKRKRKSTNKDTQRKKAARDSQRYRNGYMENLMFYQNKKRFDPDGEFIDNIHEEWKTKYDLLEENHNFIQWLFPIQEQGVNRWASPLTPEERESMKKDSKVMERFLKSYKLMLGFYGIELRNEKTGDIVCAENCEERFRNLNSNTHNNLRITRILKCLGELGYEHFQAPLVRFFLEETLCNGNLPSVKTSVLNYFMSVVKNEEERQKLVHFAWVNYKPQADFIWGPTEILKEFDPNSKGSGPLTCDTPQLSQAHSGSILVEIPVKGSSGGEVIDPNKSGWSISSVFHLIYRPFKILSKLPPLFLFSILFIAHFPYCRQKGAKFGRAIWQKWLTWSNRGSHGVTMGEQNVSLY